jgi:hypothetical protein
MQLGYKPILAEEIVAELNVFVSYYDQQGADTGTTYTLTGTVNAGNFGTGG